MKKIKGSPTIINIKGNYFVRHGFSESDQTTVIETFMTMTVFSKWKISSLLSHNSVLSGTPVRRNPIFKSF